MDLKELLHLLDIEDSAEFEYFEQYAELAETEDDIPEDVLVEFFRDVNAIALRELTEAYFEDMLTGVPDDQTELFLLLTAISTSFSGLADRVADYGSRRAYAEEFYRFRTWYARDENVTFAKPGGQDAAAMTVLDALALARAENIGKKTDTPDAVYDFSDALGYEISEYVVSVGALAEAVEAEDDDDANDDENDVDYEA
jgi:hypothetical protein